MCVREERSTKCLPMKRRLLLQVCYQFNVVQFIHVHKDFVDFSFHFTEVCQGYCILNFS